ncbi:MAG: AraC family transcriptional regulator [Sphaerochaetaceae bacterium]|nr:AraC family transcriptional regulator [Sphaerochaetaceae bacterium]
MDEPDSGIFNDIEVLWIARFDYKQNWLLSSHAHDDFFQLIYFVEGSCNVMLNGNAQRVESPAILFLPPAFEHGLSGVGAKGLKTLDTKFKVTNPALSEICRMIPPVMNIYEDDIYSALEEIRAEGEEQDYLYQEYCQLLLGRILIKLVRSSTSLKPDRTTQTSLTSGQERSLIASRIIGFLEHNYQKKITSDMLEDHIPYSYRYLSRLLEKEIGMTPIEYAEQYRILKAKELLSYGDYELKHISEIVGYPNIHQFSRSFKKVVGVPPGQWREQKRSGIGKDVVIHPEFENTLLIQVIEDGRKNTAK